MITVNDEQKLRSDKMILDTGGGFQGTIASRSWFYLKIQEFRLDWRDIRVRGIKCVQL